MQENILTWNVANWVSVVLMAVLGFAALAAISAMAKGKQTKTAPVEV